MKNERALTQNTLRLYEENGSLAHFSATVIECFPIENDTENSGARFGIEVDQTAFFPEGGGQQGDEGWIYANNASDKPETNSPVRVYTTRFDGNGRILHYTDTPLTPGMKITGQIDWKVRLNRMQNHGAEHLVCGLIHNRFGYENSGFHLNEEGAIFDVDGPLSDEQIAIIEAEANEVVYKNLPITINFPSPAEAKELEYRSKLDTFDDIRLVTIENTDVCACCAPQLDYTGQFGIIKIIDYMPHRGGMRMTLVAGLDAYKDYSKLHESNGKIMALLSSKRDMTFEYTQNFVDRLTAVNEENTSLKKELTELIADREIDRIIKRRESSNENCIPNTSESDGENIFQGKSLPETICYMEQTIEVVRHPLSDTIALRNLVNKCVAKCGGIVAGFCPSEIGYNYIVAKSDDCDTDILPLFAKYLNGMTGGRGGGNTKMIQGSVPI